MSTKITFFLTIVLVFLLCQPLFSAKWRVSNVPGVTANFTSLQTANNSSSVVSGDTIYLEGSTISYGDVSINKKLVIVGPGYFLGENDSTQAYKTAASLNNVNMNAGSEWSILTGITTNGLLSLSTTGIVVKRCNIAGQIFINSSSNIIVQSYVSKITINAPSQNNVIKNNYVYAASSQYAIYMYSGTNAVIMNNIFTSHQQICDATYRNNIATGSVVTNNGLAVLGSCTITNNIGASTQYSSYANNLNNVNMSTVFICWSSCTGYSTDRRYKLLQPSSPAIGYGYGGVDCGIFGGTEPYILSGIPTFPAIWELNLDGVTVTVKAKSH